MALSTVIVGLGQIGLGYDFELDPERYFYSTCKRRMSVHCCHGGRIAVCRSAASFISRICPESPVKYYTRGSQLDTSPNTRFTAAELMAITCRRTRG